MRRVTTATRVVLTVIALSAAAEWAIIAYDLEFPFSPDVHFPGTFLEAALFLGLMLGVVACPAAILALAAVLHEPARLRPRDQLAASEARSAPRFVVALAVATAGVWMGWIGWDGHKDVDALGNETGPWAAGQILGFVVCMVVVAAAAARWLPASAIVAVTTGVITVLWSGQFVFVINPDRPYDPMNGFWVIVVSLIFLGTVTGGLLVALPARSMWAERLSDRAGT